MSLEHYPFIVRFAGLPSSVLRDFADSICVDHLARIRELEEHAGTQRQGAVDWVYDQLTSLDPEVRRDALALKRDCFNGRNLDRHRRRKHWPLFVELPGGEVLARLADLESKLKAAREQFHELYRSQLETERRSLLRHAAHPEFQRGLALSSPLLVRQLGRLARKPVDAYRRRERKAERSTLRYLSRAAAKLSPYSTFTKLGLGIATAQTLSGNAQFLGGPWRERSLVRSKRYLIDQCAELLLRHPTVNGHVSILVNETLEKLDNGGFRFLRPAALKLHPDSQQLRTVQPSQVTVKLSGALVAWFLRTLRQPMNYAECVDAMTQEFGAQHDKDLHGALLEHLEKFLDMGFLIRRYPWPSYEPHLEKRLLSFLESLPDRSLLERPTSVLRKLVDLELGFATAADSSAALAAIESSIPEFFEAVKSTADLGASVRLERHESHNIYEDIFVTAQSTTNGAITQLPLPKARELLRAGNLIWQLGFFFEKKHEFLFALDELMRNRWPERPAVPFLQLFTEAKALWSQYLSHLAAKTSAPFDPYELPSITELQRIRRRIRRRLDSHEMPAEIGFTLPLERLEELLLEVPERYRPPVGPCLFVQAADRSGDQWVAHRIFEGNGRFSSRFTPLMSGKVLDGYLDRYIERSQIEDGLGTGELVDPIFTRGNTVNLHWPQTRRVLETPGEHSDLPAARRLTLRDLKIRRGADRGALTVEDSDGQRIVPSYLSNLHNAFIPSLIKFLNLFGTVVRGGFGPRNTAVSIGGAEVLQRFSIGPLIVRRQRWYIQRESMPDLMGKSAAEAFMALDQWRHQLKLPNRVYLIERVSSQSIADDVWKPQLLDFRSPSFVSIFQSALLAANPDQQVVLAEALPDPDDFPIDGDGEPRGLELMLEALAFDERVNGTRPPPSRPQEAHLDH